jgi:hypothetical protein
LGYHEIKKLTIEGSHLNEIAHVVVGNALVDVDSDLAGPVDKFDRQAIKKLLVRKLESVWLNYIQQPFRIVF